jgi:hypothetical protein
VARSATPPGSLCSRRPRRPARNESTPTDASSCCNEQPGPDTLLPGIVGLGGGRVGAVLLSPYIKGGIVSSVPYDHYSLLASIEDLFGLPRLGYAATTTSTFGPDVSACLAADPTSIVP